MSAYLSQFVSRMRQRHWWQSGAFAALLTLLSSLPLWLPDVPPLIDYPGHLARYKVEIGLGNSAVLPNFYSFKWALIGNLGIDLLIVPMAWLFGLEYGAKLLVIAIPVLTTAGFLWVAKEAHGRLPPTAFYALPFAYNFAFNFGFVNATLSIALAFVAFALWLRLARQERFTLRGLLFVPISIILWTCHVYGWGLLGLLAAASEYVRQREGGRRIIPAILETASSCISLTPPIVLMLVWRTGGVAGDTGDWFNIPAKVSFLVSTLTDRWLIFDAVSVIVVALLLFEALRRPRLEFDRTLGSAAIILFAAFLLLPRILLGSAYADMRLAPFAIAMALLALRPGPGASPRFVCLIFVGGLTYFGVRLAATSLSFAAFDSSFDRQLAALDHIPHGARLISFVGTECDANFSQTRFDHLPAMATVRREAFSNDQWTMAGAQLLRVKYLAGGPFSTDPSQMVTKYPCRPDRLSLDQALSKFPRDAFDYVWLIDSPKPIPGAIVGLTPIWRDGSSAVMKIEHP